MTNTEREQFAVDLTDRTPEKSQWLAIMRFGMDSLLKEPKLLMELIVRRAVREHDESMIVSKQPSDFAVELVGQLGLKFAVTSTEE